MIAFQNGCKCFKKDDLFFSFECLIQNGKYGFEFLYDSDEIFNLNRSTSVPYVYPLDYLSNLNKIRWLFQLTHNNTRVIIKSFKSNKYFCASNRHLDIFKLRRLVYLSDNFEREVCEWKLEKVFNKEINYRDQLGINSIIRNVKYDEPLYAPSYFFKKDQFKRNLYLWYDKKDQKKFKQFNWIIECSNFQYFKL